MSTTSVPSTDLMMKLLRAMPLLAPSTIYNKAKAMRKPRRRKKKMIHPELRHIWSNVATLLSSDENLSNSSSATNNYPQVDWKEVNKRFLSNIPPPTYQPILGCSSDTTFYEDKYKNERNDYGYNHNLGSKFSEPHPFGAEF